MAAASRDPGRLYGVLREGATLLRKPVGPGPCGTAYTVALVSVVPALPSDCRICLP